MKALELIEKLKAAVEEHGDLSVVTAEELQHHHIEGGVILEDGHLVIL